MASRKAIVEEPQVSTIHSVIFFNLVIFPATTIGADMQIKIRQTEGVDE